MNGIQKVTIIGAGPAGLMAALRLKMAHGISPVIYEVRSGPNSLGGAIGIPSNGLRLLNRLGLYEKVLAKGAETPTLTVHSSKGTILGETDIAAWSKSQTGFGYVRIKRADIMSVLLDAIEEANIPIFYNKHVVDIREENQGEITATFSDGTLETANLLLGCDGIHSSVRRLYVDPDCTPEYSGISNMFSLIPVARLSAVGSELKSLEATLTSDGMLGVTPNTPSRDELYWFFSRQVPIPATGDVRDGWEEKGKDEVEKIKATLLSLIGNEDNWTEMLREIVSKSDTIKFYPIYMVPPGRPWHKGRCLIIGDAAHAMPPHASQGVSMALEDIFLLSRLLHSDVSNLEDGLQAYEEKRKARTELMLKTTEKNGTVREKKGPWKLWATEMAISTGLWAYKTAGLDKLGVGQKPLAYDIEDEKF